MLLKIEDLTVSYGDRAVVKNFNLEMNEGEVVCLVGESGSGKTTVIRAVLGLLPAAGKITGGDIIFNGESLLGKTEKDFLSIRGRDMTMIFQDSGSMLNPVRKIGAQFLEYIRLHENLTKAEAKKRAMEMLEEVRLPDADNIMQSYPFQLSGGMRQRVGIAMALAFHPKLLLADEPTSALDVTIQAQIVRQMMELQKLEKTSIIMVTHNLGVATYMSNHIVVMKNGEIVEAGTRDEIMYHPQHEYTQNLIAAIPTMEGEPYVEY
ncbi:MAG: ABC transporter ATP-binding protein [Lachnospiraceae bacterium]|nr:ABC transporter ATP-binding protein [Lachnospiraceae bacterium]MBQ1400423.1 ABC transporter ATP-binding protein [Lachnospiraceae bacterium]